MWSQNQLQCSIEGARSENPEPGGFMAGPAIRQFAFVHLLNTHSKASIMQKRSKNNAKRAPELHHFRIVFLLYAVVGGAAISLRRAQAGSPTALGIHGADSNALKMAF
jgi:hypothetical protein